MTTDGARMSRGGADLPLALMARLKSLADHLPATVARMLFRSFFPAFGTNLLPIRAGMAHPGFIASDAKRKPREIP